MEKEKHRVKISNEILISRIKAYIERLSDPEINKKANAQFILKTILTNSHV